MTRPQEDILVRHARREAALALAMWLAAMLYTIGYCYLHGYGRPSESLSFVLWFPDWVFWGIVVPWGICVAVSLVFAFRIMGDEPLGEEIDADRPEMNERPTNDFTGDFTGGEHRGEVRDG